MNIWLIKANEPMPTPDNQDHLGRMGHLADELVNRGHHVTWFGTTFDHYKKEQLFMSDTEIEVKSNFKLFFIWSPPYKTNRSIGRAYNHWYLKKRIYTITSDVVPPDIIVCAYPTIDFSKFAIAYGQAHDIPIVLDIRDLWPYIFTYTLKGLAKYIAYPYIAYQKTVASRLLNKATVLTGVSDGVIHWVQHQIKRVNAEDRSFYIGYETPVDSLVNDPSINESSTKQEFVVTYIGILDDLIDYDVLFELSKRFQEISFMICGTGVKYKEVKKRFEGCTNVHFKGWLNKEEMHKVLRESDVGLCNYIDRFDFRLGCSNKFSEYLAYGLPVIVSFESEMGRMLEAHDCGIGTHHLGSIYTYLETLLNSKELLHKQKRNALKLFDEKFDIRNIYKSFAKHIECIAKR